MESGGFTMAVREDGIYGEPGRTNQEFGAIIDGIALRIPEWRAQAQKVLAMGAASTVAIEYPPSTATPKRDV